MKQAFAKLFAKFLPNFRNLFDVFASFLKFSDLLRPVRIHSDAFGCIRMHLDASGCVQILSEKFENFNEKILFLVFSPGMASASAIGRFLGAPRRSSGGGVMAISLLILNGKE